MYKLHKSLLLGETVFVCKYTDGFVLSIPCDPANTDYQEYLEWLAEGNEPEPADEAGELTIQEADAE